jgi:acyl-CoA synthetase (AMP-forming)/AMP-acid ligase II
MERRQRRLQNGQSVKIKLWRGSHGSEVKDLIKKTWKSEDLLILYPPKVTDTSFLPAVEKADFPEPPIFGIFSTGTTGQKLVLYSKKNIESSLQSILSLFDKAKIKTIFNYPQPYHTFGLILGYCHALLYDKRLIPLEGPYSSRYHDAWLDNIEENQLTLGTPTHFKDLLKYVLENKLNPVPTYTAIMGAARVEVELWKSLKRHLNILAPSIGYGATEASPGITHLPPGQAPKEDGEVGYFLKHLKSELIEGEGVQFSGPSVCLATVLNGQISFPDKILIRDRLEKRSDGVLVYRGRYEVLLNRGGEKFPLEEIEVFLKTKLGVDAVCVAVPHPRLGEELGILVRDDAEKNAIYSALKEEFGREFDSNYFAFTDHFPVNPNSKTDRQECQKKVLSEIH